MKSYIFDVDGTLASSREPMDSTFMRWFEHWMLKRDVYLCTNNTYANIFPRLGRRLVEKTKAVFTCGGNSIWMNGKEAKVNDWRPSSELISFLETCLKNSEFKIRSGPNIEHRTGLISFSVVGKMASNEERTRYQLYDKTVKERKKIIDKLNENFEDLFACSGGMTSIDICKKGFDKSQILKYFDTTNNLTFIGDEFSVIGNDKKLVEAIDKTNNSVYNTHHVNSWQETFDYLKKIR